METSAFGVQGESEARNWGSSYGAATLHIRVNTAVWMWSWAAEQTGAFHVLSTKY